ncbi:hypothetical protein [Sutcliffiella horikoshii]|uniref:hypothetical protein n=1 Tax=Sutcliffiella horikoshii TaxID=79883 RepID=UPI001653584F|nr:hypothetical protein [Sutcliffiella horikoshii]
MDEKTCNTVDFRSRRFACLRAVREPPQASPSGVSPVPSSRGGLRAFHSNQQGDFIHRRVQSPQLMMKEGFRHEYISEWIALELFLGEPLDKVSDLAREHPEQGIYDVRIDWGMLIKNLQTEEEQFDGYIREVQEVMGWVIQEDNKRLEEWLTHTSKVELKRLVKELRK